MELIERGPGWDELVRGNEKESTDGMKAECQWAGSRERKRERNMVICLRRSRT